MKKLILAVGLVALFAGSASAISAGPGGYIYWTQSAGGSYPDPQQMIFRMEIGTDWRPTQGSGNGGNYNDHFSSPLREFVDNVPFLNHYSYVSPQNNLEVMDPRHLGGTGMLMQPTIYDNVPGFSVPPAAHIYRWPWDLIKVDPTAPAGSKQSQLVYSRAPVDTDWRTEWMGHYVTAPEDWGGVSSNGLSIATVQDGVVGANVQALYDTDSSHQIDNDANEGHPVVTVSGRTGDVEMAPDGALYIGQAETNGLGHVKRVWIDGAGVGHQTTFFTVGGALNPVYSDGELCALAAPNKPGNPYIYLFGQDNVTHNMAIFALKDGDGDNVVNFDGTGGDVVATVWKHGEDNISSPRTGVYAEDLEYYWNPQNGAQFLLANDYDGEMWVLELTDNHADVAASWPIIYNQGDGYFNGPVGAAQQCGFELDFNAVVVPEPATLMLVGTGVLGALGYIRRRRMR